MSDFGLMHGGIRVELVTRNGTKAFALPLSFNMIEDKLMLLSWTRERLPDLLVSWLEEAV